MWPLHLVIHKKFHSSCFSAYMYQERGTSQKVKHSSPSLTATHKGLPEQHTRSPKPDSDNGLQGFEKGYHLCHVTKKILEKK
uniref:DNA-directed RNA polymerase IV subunit 1 n=1 Tax=Rhizophora mucronata TaxID=61149 RepID=A0A2P2JM71_RHIMU